jgi:hypothetical protein
MRFQRIVLPTLVGVALLGAAAAMLRPAPALAQAQRELPPVTYICPMPQDEVFEDKPGRCPICGMDLVPVRIDTAFSCPDHPAVITDKPGICPIDKRRELVQVTVNIHWECGNLPGQHFTEPGLCANGQARREVKELRVHGDHNPRYGGQFFMAADKWHHLEGTYPQPGVFRLFFYDNFTQPLAAKGATGRVALVDQTYTEVASFPLAVSRDGQTLEAQIKGGSLPMRLRALVKFDDKTPEQPFDFNFTELSVAPVKPAATTTTAMPAQRTAPQPPAQAAQAPASTAPAQVFTLPSPPPPPPPSPPAAPPALSQAQLTADATTMSRSDAAALAENLPGNSPELIALLDVRDTEVRTAIDDGQFGFVYNPAMISKDIALALEPLASTLPGSDRARAADAVRRLVLSAWYLDLYGDMGNGEKLRETYKQFAAAVADIKAVYGKQR